MSEGSTIESGLHAQRVFDPPVNAARGERTSGMEAQRAVAEAAKAEPEAVWG